MIIVVASCACSAQVDTLSRTRRTTAAASHLAKQALPRGTAPAFSSVACVPRGGKLLKTACVSIQLFHYQDPIKAQTKTKTLAS